MVSFDDLVNEYLANADAYSATVSKTEIIDLMKIQANRELKDKIKPK